MARLSQKKLWPNEPDASEAVDLLGEWYGYVISGRLDLQKIFMNIGPTRGGKGIIARVLTRSARSDRTFGRSDAQQPWRRLRSCSRSSANRWRSSRDARFVGKDSGVVVERLLSISGEDTLTVNRKFRDQWTGKLPTRLHVISNELPRLGDASTAIVGRIILLLTSVLVVGQGGSQTRTETSTLNCPASSTIRTRWLAAFDRQREPCSRVLASADDAIVAMRDLASPVGAFVREKCEIGADKGVAADTLYTAYKVWAEENGHPKVTKQTFGRDLRAAVSAIRRLRPREGVERQYFYAGIALRSDL